ncbi:MAG: hypothetical protein ACRD7E_14530, partial [Bryobacteraceae bacterium]
SKTSASRERTPIPEDCEEKVVTTGFPRSGLVQYAKSRATVFVTNMVMVFDENMPARAAVSDRIAP